MIRYKKEILRISIIIIVLGLIIGFLGCNRGKTVTRSDFLLDTFVSVTLFEESDETLLNEPFEKIRELNATLTAFDKGSDLEKIKQNAGIMPVVVSDDTFEIIRKSIEYSKISNGYFDVSIGPLVELWNIEVPEIKDPPVISLIDAERKKIDYTKIVLDKNNKTVYLEEAGMAINLGAIAKGYIADVIMTIIENEGVEHALINLGGNVLVSGGKSMNNPFGVGIEDPLNPGNGYIGVLSLSNGAIVTSGNYQRYFTDSTGKKYHHILDPYTGYPSESGLIQVTVVAKDSIDADALSTTLFLLGLDEGLKLVEEKEDVEALFITQENKIIVTKGLKEMFVFDDQNYGDTYTVTIER
jgi:thiamine biosynthesis lipoprotein